ncbi:NAD(P)H-dependent FMN reductase [Ferrithrix thermotolerans DSM 19514]|uniref:NAD(P)H-dependent FMN reductase n=1 Tax=Ferrithrix thermotolerans DSM 19514 TaxID=1121881 RepID=A0A1M4X3T3_9ACTN|nr:NAD(P)H-dependent oxidoreductase [Ferrithrix thermotolerans]SHE88146.1 NAD(P)H-dependent FMN reductase [Ferrithrix thermotolerans DSM 19514]
MGKELKFLGISGSIRNGSYNRAVLEFLGSLMPQGIDYEIFDDISDIPFYDQSLEEKLPYRAKELREAVEGADGLIIATPEHNASISAALKNALEWLSRPVGQGAIEGKPVAILGAAPGLYGTIRSQIHLRQILHSVGAVAVQKPEVYINQIGSKLSEGTLNDEVAVDLLSQMLRALQRLVSQHVLLNQELKKESAA